MGRSIISLQQGASKNDLITATGDQYIANTPDTYFDKLYKYIPGEVIGLYLMGINIIDSIPSKIIVMWVFSLFCFVGTYFFLKKVVRVKTTKQNIISTFAFLVWAFAIGGPFKELSWYSPQLGSLILGMYTFIIPIIDPNQ